MSLADDISRELTEAMKAREETKVSTLRMLSAAFKNAQISKGSELDDEEILGVIGKSAKSHKESIESFEKAGRYDLVDREKAELGILQKYLPEQMSQDEVSRIVDEVIGEVGAGSQAEMGKVMGQVMVRVKGRVDGGVVSSIVKSRLG